MTREEAIKNIKEHCYFANLIPQAKEALDMRRFSYHPYSGFAVGAALLGKSGRVYTGCNIENSSYSLTVCAERTAIFKAVSEGCTAFSAIAVVGGDMVKPCYPCGACLQVMSEFCGDDFMIYMGGAEGYTALTMSQILPAGFKASEHMKL